MKVELGRWGVGEKGVAAKDLLLTFVIACFCDISNGSSG